MVEFTVANGTKFINKNTLGTIAVNTLVDGVLTNAAGNVTVTVVDEQGNTVVDAQTASTSTTGVYTYDLGITNTTDVKKLTATWTGTFESVVQKGDLIYEVVGLDLFSLNSARSFDDSKLQSSTTYTTANILDERYTLTNLLEEYTGQGWIPRFKRDRLQGESTEAITLDKRIVNKIIRVEVNGTVVANDNFQVDKITGVLFRIDGSIFPYPTRTKPFNVVVDYEYGHDYVKNGVDRIGLKLLIDRIVSSNISDRTRSYQDEIATIQFITEGGPMNNITRLPEVNSWIEANSIRQVAS
jgi:hypothetical protein